MTIASDSSIEAKLEQIPPSFKEMAKEELKKEITKLNPSLAWDPDKIYVNIIRDGSISSETLTEALLKRSLNEQNFLSDNLAKLYLNPTDINVENQSKEVNISDLNNSIDRLSAELINTYYKQLDDFWTSHKISIPEELQANPIDNFLQNLIESSSLIEKAYQLDTMYPHLKHTIISYFNNKLKKMHNKVINLDTVRVLIFHKESEDTRLPFLDLELTNFVLNYSWFSHASNISLQIKSQDVPNLKLDEIASDILAIQSQHQTKLELFWQKNFTNYQILAKFSYLRVLLEQQSSTMKLSEKGFKLALLAIGLSQEKAEIVSKLDPKEIPLDILETPSTPTDVEVSCLAINAQTASDILKIRDTKTNNLVVYIPGNTHSFIEAMNLNHLIHWVLFQTESPDNLAKIASHFSHSIRMANDSKLDAFLSPDDSKDIHAFLSPDDSKQNKTLARGDIFSFITERQKVRVAADLHASNLPKSIQVGSVLNYQSTESAFFTTIAAAMEYIPYLLPNIHAAFSHLSELFPNPYITASEFMKKEIKEKLLLDLDPDTTFIGYFLPRNTYFTELNKSDYCQTQSLTEAALSNYRHDFNRFSSRALVFIDPSGKGNDFPSKEQIVPVLPKDIEEIIIDADLDTLHKNKLDSFWNTHEDQMKHFIKQRYLQQVLEEHQNKNLSKKDLKILLEVTLYSLNIEEDLSDFIHSNISIEIICVAGYQSTDLFVFRKTDQPRVILYIAENTTAFFAFESYEDCICSLEETAKKKPKWQKLLLSHFSMDVQDSVLQALKKGPYIEGSSLATAPRQRSVDCSFKNIYIQHPITTKPIEKSLFKTIQKNIQERSYLDANVIIISDRELILNHLLNITKSIEFLLLIPSFGFPLLNWGILAALITEVAANLYITKKADTVKERHQAAMDLGISSVEFIFCMAFLSLRSLKFSKNQTKLILQDQEKLHLSSSGSGVFSFSEKKPIAEELFFDTTKSMRVWQMADSDGLLKHLDAKAWFLDEQFLLFTGKENRAKHLIISSHGGYLPKSGIVQVPKNTELVVLGPHGWQLVDPETVKIAKGLVLPYGIINESAAIPTQTAFYPSLFSRSANTHIHPRKTDIKLLAGTNKPGHIRNYTLAKYQKFGAGEESYLDIVRTIHHSRHPFPNIYKIGFQPVDILTIRNRRGKLFPNLADVFKSLSKLNIHYDRITLEFCRSKISFSATNPTLKYSPAKKFSL